MKPDYSVMAKRELRSYVVSHPNDKEAFQVFVDRSAAEAPSEAFNIPQSSDDLAEVDALIRQKLAQSEAS